MASSGKKKGGKGREAPPAPVETSIDPLPQEELPTISEEVKNVKGTPPEKPKTINFSLSPQEGAVLLQILTAFCERGNLKPEETIAFGVVYNKLKQSIGSP